MRLVAGEHREGRAGAAVELGGQARAAPHHHVPAAQREQVPLQEMQVSITHFPPDYVVRLPATLTHLQ